MKFRTYGGLFIGSEKNHEGQRSKTEGSEKTIWPREIFGDEVRRISKRFRGTHSQTYATDGGYVFDKNAIWTRNIFEVAEQYFEVTGRVSAPETLSLHVKSLKKSIPVASL